MPSEPVIPGLGIENAGMLAASAQHYLAHYEIAVNRVMAARGPDEILGCEPRVCRFCNRSKPAVSFGSDAHAVPELAGNGTLISLYECDDCNARFSAFEDDLGKLTLLERSAGQVLGKRGVPSVTTGQKKSRIDVGANGFQIQEHEGDPIAVIDHDKKTLTVTIAPQAYRPLGAYKALVKIALTLMADVDLAKVPEAVRWLLEKDLVTNQVSDCTAYSCVRSWTSGPLPIAQTTVMLLRRKPSYQAGPTYIMVLAFGNISFQIVVPAPQEDAVIGSNPITIWPIPIVAFLKTESVRAPTRYWVDSLASSLPKKGAPSMVFSYDSLIEVPSATLPE